MKKKTNRKEEKVVICPPAAQAQLINTNAVKSIRRIARSFPEHS
jgi:hypothetical protein